MKILRKIETHTEHYNALKSKIWQKHLDLFDEWIGKYKNPDGIFLDGGCGTGQFLYRYSNHFKLCVGIDIEIPNERANGENVEYIRENLEHLKNPSLVFKEIGRALKPGGMFLSWLPNAISPSGLVIRILPFSLKKFLKKIIVGKKDLDVFPTYYSANTCSKLDGMLQRENFRRIYLEMANGTGYLSKWKWGWYMHMLCVKICNSHEYFNRFKSHIFVVSRITKDETRPKF